MWKFGYGRDYALALVCEGRPVCSPNPGFMEQLEVYERMLARPLRDKEGRREIYEAWLGDRFKGYFHEWEARTDAATKAKL
jgi:dual specificity phosphatase 12